MFTYSRKHEEVGNHFNALAWFSRFSLKKTFLRSVMLFIRSPNNTYSRALATLRATKASRSNCSRMSAATIFARRATRTSRALGKKDCVNQRKSHKGAESGAHACHRLYLGDKCLWAHLPWGQQDPRGQKHLGHHDDPSKEKTGKSYFQNICQKVDF